ncbi:C-terminal motor kinesin, putative [Bodo saltans]|uniref:Kinesin-like protein n=1 Tax=Bodo saltans TaxID=75058 RepID=A0A0S4KHP9_BODSA|nr:C-terminal motor kinesin, putative [Bodo saltans]|eukprot:CUI14124.1 C-terminal motor kinesin, putative [Bodo saltans]
MRIHGPDIVLDQLKTNLKHGTPEMQIRSLNILNQCVLNSGQNVIIALSSEKWCERFTNVAKTTKSDAVRDHVIRQLLIWYHKYRTNGLEQCLGRFGQSKQLKTPFLNMSRLVKQAIERRNAANNAASGGSGSSGGGNTPPASPTYVDPNGSSFGGSSGYQQRPRATTSAAQNQRDAIFQGASGGQRVQPSSFHQQQQYQQQRQSGYSFSSSQNGAAQGASRDADGISNLETFILDAQGDLASLEYGLSHPDMLDRSVALDCQRHKKEVGRKLTVYMDIIPPQYNEALMRLLENLSNALDSYEMFSGEDLGEGGLSRLKSYGAPAFAQAYNSPSRQAPAASSNANGAHGDDNDEDDEGGSPHHPKAVLRRGDSVAGEAHRQAVEAQQESIRLLDVERQELASAREEVKRLQVQYEEVQAKYKDAKTKNKKALNMITESTNQIEELENRIAELEEGGAATGGDPQRLTSSQKIVEKVVVKAPEVDEAVVHKLRHNIQTIRRDLRELKTATLPDWRRDFQFMSSQVTGAIANIVVAAQAERAGDVKALQWAQELYRKEMKLRKQYYNQIQELKGNIRVFCRVRPMSRKELSDGHTEVTSFSAEGGNDELRLVDNNGRTRVFEFDNVYSPDTTQTKVFEDTAPLIDSVVDGFNVCIFAYGQTGSGKTFTMTGYDDKGINKRALDRLFQIIEERRESEESTVSVSVLEIYCEQIRDLLATRSEANRLTYDVKTGGPFGNYVTNLSESEVTSPAEIDSIMDRASSNRSEGKTDMNAHSSRSHMVLYVIVRTRNLHTGVQSYGKLSLVDLAGSERLDKSGSEGQAAKEAVAINKSLSALGDVIAGLSNTGQKHIPFRNSILTFLLQDSMAGQAKVLMFCCVSPASYNVNESFSSLQFATRARGVSLGQAKKNVIS